MIEYSKANKDDDIVVSSQIQICFDEVDLHHLKSTSSEGGGTTHVI